MRHGPRREIDGRQPEERPPGVIMAEEQAEIAVIEASWKEEQMKTPPPATYIEEESEDSKATWCSNLES